MAADLSRGHANNEFSANVEFAKAAKACKFAFSCNLSLCNDSGPGLAGEKSLTTVWRLRARSMQLNAKCCIIRTIRSNLHRIKMYGPTVQITSVRRRAICSVLHLIDSFHRLCSLFYSTEIYAVLL